MSLKLAAFRSDPVATTTLRLGGSADFDAEGFRRFVGDIERLVPFLASSFASLSNARLGGCSSALRRDLV